MRGYSNFLKFPFRLRELEKKVISHDILIVLIDINPFFHILQIELASGQEENPFQVDPDEITEAAPQELIIDEDEEGDSGIDIDELCRYFTFFSLIVLKF